MFLREVIKTDEATKEIITNEQHNCKAAGFWKTNTIKYHFLLLAHEYLFVFRKNIRRLKKSCFNFEIDIYSNLF